MAWIDPCLYLQSDAHPARTFRQLITAMLAEGILGPTSLAVTQRASGGANFSVDVAAGMVCIKGDSAAQQGHYIAVNDATITNDAQTAVTSAPSAGNERYDIVIAEVKDNAEDAGGINTPRCRVVAGNPAAVGTATAPATPNTAVKLATIGPIVNGTTSITNSLITDNRVISRLANEVVATASIADLAVTTAKLADNSVTSAKIVDGTIAFTDIAAAAYAAAPTGGLLAQRTVSGDLQVPAIPAGTLDATSKSYVDALLNVTWGYLPLASGWAAPSGIDAATYTRIGSIIIVAGGVARSGGSGVCGTLPAGYRPVAQSYGTCVITGPGGTGGVPAIVATNGDVTPAGISAGNQGAIMFVFRAP